VSPHKTCALKASRAASFGSNKFASSLWMDFEQPGSETGTDDPRLTVLWRPVVKGNVTSDHAQIVAAS
jgi:hypothetical protein